MIEFKYFKEAESAEWRDWTSGRIDGRGLKKRDPVAVTLNGVTVHSLAAQDGAEWNCVQGWVNVEDLADKIAPAPEPAPAPVAADHAAERAQAYALRVWSGQSSDLGRAERVKRVKAALEGQGLPADGIKLPGDADTDDEWTEEDSKPVTWRKTA